MTEVTIRSESDFLDLAKKVLIDNDSSISKVQFDSWPTIEFYIKGDRYHQSLPISAMEGYVGFQQEIYRLFTDLKYNQPSLNTLKLSDRDDLELVFKILDGSSDTKADGWAVLNKLTDSLEASMAGMDGMEKLILILLLAGLLGGVFCFYLWNKRKADNEQFHALQETTRKVVDASTSNVKTMAQSYEVLLASHPKLNSQHSKVAQYADQAYSNVLKKVSDADYIRSGNNEFTGAEIKEFSRRKRGESGQRNEKTDIFYIEGIDRPCESEFVTIKTLKKNDSSKVRMKAFNSIIGSDLDDLLKAFSQGSTVKIRYISSTRGDEEYDAQFSYIEQELENENIA